VRPTTRPRTGRSLLAEKPGSSTKTRSKPLAISSHTKVDGDPDFLGFAVAIMAVSDRSLRPCLTKGIVGILGFEAVVSAYRGRASTRPSS